MKIENNQIRISGQITAPDMLKNLKEGSRLAVRISERLGERHAVLDIGGRKIYAEFLNGVPKSGSLFLTLEKEVKGTLFFNIAEGTREDLIGELSKSTIFTLNDLNKSINELRLYLRESIYSIFSLNKTLIKFTGFAEEEEKKLEKIINLLNKMLLRGADQKDLLLISAIVNQGKNPFAHIFFIIISRLLPGYRQIFDRSEIEKKIEKFFDFLNKSFTESSENDKIETVKTILDLCFNKSGKDNLLHGKLIFFDDNKFKLCKYISNGNSIVLSLDLSCLGGLEILIKEEKPFRSVSFFCEKERTIEALKSEIKVLESAINSEEKKKTYISFFDGKKSIEKIIEIISAIDLNYLFDKKA
jgi:hypothetical protein